MHVDDVADVADAADAADRVFQQVIGMGEGLVLCDVVAQQFEQLFVPHPASDYEAEWPLAVRLSEARITIQGCRDCKNSIRAEAKFGFMPCELLAG